MASAMYKESLKLLKDSGIRLDEYAQHMERVAVFLYVKFQIFFIMFYKTIWKINFSKFDFMLDLLQLIFWCFNCNIYGSCSNFVSKLIIFLMISEEIELWNLKFAQIPLILGNEIWRRSPNSSVLFTFLSK